MDYYNWLTIHLLKDILVIMDNAAVNICLYIYICFNYVLSILWGIHLGVELLDHIIPHLTLLRNCRTLPQCLHHFHSHQLCYEGSSFSTYSTRYFLFYFYYSYTNGCADVSQCCFDLHFPIDVEHRFMFLLATCVSLVKCIFKSLPIFILSFLSFCCYEFFIYCERKWMKKNEKPLSRYRSMEF